MKYLILLFIFLSFFSCIPRKCCPDVITWKRGKSTNSEFYGSMAFSEGYMVYSLSESSNNFESYNTQTKEWVKLPAIPISVSSACGVIYNQAIYIFGGIDSLINFVTVVQKFDLEKNLWMKMLPMKNPRIEAASVVCLNKIYLVGGKTENKSENGFNSGIVEEYDPIHDSWIKKSDMPIPTQSHAVVAIGNKILVAGGYTQAGITAIVEEYDPLEDQWTRKADMPFPNFSFDLISLQNTIYSFGGYTYTDSPILKYDVNADQWTQVSILPKGKSYYGITVANDRIYIIGGHRKERSVLIGKRG